ncbi:MAG: transglutaminase-like domain-containing protein, partial [Acidobacteriota bacterium]
LKARQLTEGAADPLSRLRALAEFVQKEVRYVAIEIGIGGYKPHPAVSILSNRYGDCKDKATLLASLLESQGIESHYVLVHTSRGNITADSPVTLYGFNHVILAIRLPEDVAEASFPAAVLHSKLGRLLIFDPTSSYSPLGSLPISLQGGTGLLVTEGGGELVPLPMPAPEANLLDRHGRFSLAADGTLEGEIRETRRGTIAAQIRGALRDATDAERTKYMETFLGDSLAGSVLQANEFKNLDDNASDLKLTYRFRVPRYAKAAGGMMVVRPRIVGHKSERLETAEAKPRRYPIDLDGTCLQRDEFVIELAEGCRVEGLPPAADIDAGFAVYKSRTEESGRTVVYRREYRLLQPELPSARFDEAVRFFRAMDADERQSILLKK